MAMNQIRRNSNAFTCDNLARNGTGGHTHRRLARGAAPTAAIIADAVFRLIGEIRVAWAEAVLDIPVILRFLVFVLDDERDGRARRFALEHATQNFYCVGFLALGGEFRLGWLALIQPWLNVGFAKVDKRWASIHHTANGLAVGFPPCRETENGTK
jgi:hypothetical protein